MPSIVAWFSLPPHLAVFRCLPASRGFRGVTSQPYVLAPPLCGPPRFFPHLALSIALDSRWPRYSGRARDPSRRPPPLAFSAGARSEHSLAVALGQARDGDDGDFLSWMDQVRTASAFAEIPAHLRYDRSRRVPRLSVQRVSFRARPISDSITPLGLQLVDNSARADTRFACFTKLFFVGGAFTTNSSSIPNSSLLVPAVLRQNSQTPHSPCRSPS